MNLRFETIFALILVVTGSESLGQYYGRSLSHFNDTVVDTSDTMKMNSPSANDSSPSPSDMSVESAPNEALSQVITEMVLKNIPHHYIDDRKWGLQEERFDGLDIRWDDDRIKTKRKKKLVNHGNWQKYSVELINPEDSFAIEVGEMQLRDDGKLEFDVCFVSQLALFGRHAKWFKGVQQYSVSIEGEAVVRLSLRCELGIDFVFRHGRANVVFSPVAKQAAIQLDEFKIHRVSKLGGEFAQQVTKGARSILDKKIEEHEEKLVEKINAQIDKKRDRLTISLNDALKSKWAEKAMPHLPAHLRDTVESK
ncbi:MAG TPA: hypothetical protein PKD64_10010 [Pirellulaceae bacterium]|nr:hypothetical protein [Pirellulaceae bacterium]HMO92515.1 hypothetical protein [Pirellulaceae bacterium]HMP69002.1 hypothetical protein [Pirellulaceae bacterium]